MFLRIKIIFALNVALLLGCFLITPLMAGQTTAGGDSSTDNTAPKKPAIDTTAAEEKAANESAAKVAAEAAAKEAKANAEKKAAKKKEFEDAPLSVTCIEPYVESKAKGTCNPNDAKQSIPGKAGMGDRVKVVIQRLSDAAKYDVVDPTKLVLFIDGRVFTGVVPESVGYDSVVYKLERTKDAIDAWNGLLGSPSLEPLRPVVVSVGYADQKPLELAKDFPQKTNLDLIVYRKSWAVGSLIGLILMVLVFWKYGGRELLRDSGPPNVEPGKRPYSLAKVQVAWWFFLVIGCFLLIYLITGEYTMTEQALILIGIGTGTALGSAMIENSKRGSADGELETLKPQYAKLKAEVDKLNVDKETLEKAVNANQGATDAEKAALKTDRESLDVRKIELAGKTEELKGVSAKIADAEAGLTKPLSGGLWNDLVTDAEGLSFHRFQMIAWTVILGILFLAGVYKNLAMPEFSGTMLALMGISAGTYLGFKIPEKQNTPNPAAPIPTTPQPEAQAAPAQQDAAAQAP